MQNNIPQQPALNVDINQLETIKCEKCGNATFVQVLLMKKVSALISPTGKEGLVPIPVFACNSCNHVNKQFLPQPVREEKENVKSSNIPPLKKPISLVRE